MTTYHEAYTNLSRSRRQQYENENDGSTRQPIKEFEFLRRARVVHYLGGGPCDISIRTLRLLRILTDLNELRINVGHVWELEHCAATGILAATDYTFTTPD